jgi:hypothetical protein
MKIEIEQNCSGTGKFRWEFFTGPEHIDVFSGTADTLGECFQEIIRMDTLNAQHYYGVMVEEPSKPMNEVMNRLENKYKQAEENAASYITDEVVDRMVKKWETDPPSFLRFQLGKTLEALITRWWDDVYDGIHQDWDREVAIDDLIDQIQLWLPREGSSEGSQDHYAIVATDAENALLQKIKSKLRNKK